MFNLAVLFGGESSEHDVSLVSASFVIETCGKLEDVNVLPIGITADGRWFLFTGDHSLIKDDSWLEREGEALPLYFNLDPGNPGFHYKQNGAMKFQALDCVFPVLHGKRGEDGTVQGLFELMGVPYVGCGVLASATGMDKVASRMMFDHAGIPQAEWTWLRVERYREKPDQALDEVEAVLPYPMFVKPANAGSSVGIGKAKNRAELAAALEVAFKHDFKAVIEIAVEARELEVSVLETHDTDDLTVSVAGEILPAGEFYDYDSKYNNPDSKLLIPADIPQTTYDTIVTYAKRAFRMVDGKGLCRADFFVLKADGSVLLNEINTMPGFTAISMYPKLLDASGIDAVSLMRILIETACRNHQR